MTQPHPFDTQLSPLKRALLALDEMQNKLDAAQAAAHQPIAVIGLGCRFAGGAATPAAYWDLLRRGGQATSEPPPDRAALLAVPGDAAGSCRAGYLQDAVDGFDPQFFGIAPREAHGMDPQQRLLLEVAWEALESACQAPDRLQGTRTGVYVGVSTSDYLHVYLKADDPALIDGYHASGIAPSIVSGRLSYLLGLQGPSLTVDTACSSSLAAVHLAVQSLRSGETDLALAGGVNLMLAPENFLALHRFGMLAADGSCKTFDAAADGYGRGEGCGVVVLKRLADAEADGDRILAVIRGTAMNQDGASSGLTAPNGPAQEGVVRAALADAGVDPALVGLIETHGTGTPLGDPIEVQALGNVFGASHTPERPLYLNAVKANLGHTEAAAGVAGLIKLVLALQHGEIPPQANFRSPNPYIPWAKLPLVVPTQVTPWPPAAGRRIAGLSAFGFSGTNVHVVVEAAPGAVEADHAPAAADEAAAAADRPLHLLALAAKHPAALAELAARYAAHLQPQAADPGQPVAADGGSLADICYAANTGRAHFAQRLTVVAATRDELAQKLGAFAAGEETPGVAAADAERSARPKIAFLFTGQGAQYAGMGRQLYATQPAFRAALDACAAILAEHLDTPLLDLLDPPAGAPNRLDDTTYTQPALFAFEYALAQLWQAWGVTPNFVLGHSVGEYVAATLAGVFSLADALKLIAARGRLMGSLPAGGAMAAVFAPEEVVAAALQPYAATVAIAALNGPDNTVISGRGEDVAAVVASLGAQGIKARALKVSHAFHSPLLEPMIGAFAEVAATVAYRDPRLRLISNVTGEVAGAAVANAAYWRDHTRAPVRFAASIATLHRQGVEIFLEIGPGSTLIGMGERCLEDRAEGPLWLASLKPPRSEWAVLLDSLAALYRAGVQVDWAGFDRPYARRKLALPTYPFQRQRYWLPVGPRTARADGTAGDNGAGETPAPVLGSGAAVRVSAASEGAAAAHAAPAHPLLGRRLRSALAATQYEVALNSAELTFLNDHRVLGAAVLPGAAYLEAALAIGRQLAAGGVDVHDLLLQEALAVPDGETRIAQWIVTPLGGGEYRFECYSRASTTAAPDDAGADEWRLHAQARLLPAAPAAPAALPALDLAALRAALPTPVTAAAHYAQLAFSGMNFGPSLWGVTELWRKDGEALGRIALTEAVAAEAGAYRLHPALLDANLQVIAAAVSARAGAYMPFSVDRFVLCRPGVQPAWSHALVTGNAESDAVIRADLQLLDASGGVVALVEGMTLKRVEGRAAPFADWLYEVTWETQPLAEAVPYAAAPAGAPAAPPASLWPPLAPVAGDLAGRLEQLEEQHDLVTYALDVAPALDRLSLAWLAAALRELGWQYAPGSRFATDELVKALGIAPRHVRLLGRLCEILAEEGIVERAGDGWQVCAALPAIDALALEQTLRRQHPAYTAEVELTVRCGRQLAAALAGRIDPVHLLFPQGDLSTTEALYRESPSARVYNGLMRATVEQLVARRGTLPDGAPAPLRVLEIGGGTGGTTAYLLPMLPAERTSYLFTDISPLFVARAEVKFGHHAFAAFAVLDLEKDPDAQGLAERQFDLIVAANVVHATADLHQSLGHIRRLLAPDGLLVMLEVTGPQRWIDITFGLTDGWWRFTDTGLRQGYPLLNIAQWQALLADCGFDATVAVPGADGAGFIDQAVIMAHQPLAPAGGDDRTAAAGHWLLLADAGGAGGRLAQRLQARGARVTLAWAGPAYARRGDGSFELDPMQPEHFRRLLQTLEDEALAGVVHLWSLDVPPGDLQPEALERALALSTAGALHLAQALAAYSGQTTPRLWLVTQGAQAVPPDSGAADAAAANGAADVALAVAQAPLWGLGQALTLEHAEWQPTLIDLDGTGDAALDNLLAELLAADAEDRIVWRGGQRRVARLAHSRRLTPASDASAQPVQLEIAERGTLQQLVLRPLTRRAPAPGQVEIRVRATGLNFKDVLNTLGMYPGDAGPLGGECAGEIVAVGDGVSDLQVGQRVLAIAPGAFRSHVPADARLTAPLPDGMSYAEGASIPIAFVTAAYTLRHLAGLRAGERVLIHAAAGGVGLAAVQLAQAAGAEVFATAGSASKRAYLRSLGVAHVFDSRTLAFAEEVRAATGGQGVDVVLNSLAGDFIAASLALLAPGGRFLEIGKSGLLTPQEAAALGADRQYFIIDWTDAALENPALIRGLLDQVLAEMAAGQLQPLPHRLFALSAVDAAFRYMAQARHIGKIVVLADDAGEERASLPVRPGATYLITGGLRGLGLLTAGWLAQQGAGALALVARSAPDAEARAAIAQLEAGGCRVLPLQADVSRRADVQRVLAAIAEQLPPLAGVIHAAGVLDDGALIQQNWARFETVMAPKVQGAWHLHQLTEHLPLDFFVLYSSVASLLGSAGQGNHSAANAFLDALAHYRRSVGLPAVSINWGIWSEVGIAAARAVGVQRSEQGLGTIAPQNGLHVLRWIMEQQPVQVGVTPINWAAYLHSFAGGSRRFFAQVTPQARPAAAIATPGHAAGVQPAARQQEPAASVAQAGAQAGAAGLLDELAALAPAKRRARLLAFIKTQTAQVLGLDAAACSERTPLNEMGLDSLMAVELRNVLSQRMGLKRSLPATLVFDYPTIGAIADFLLRDILALDAAPPGAQADRPQAASAPAPTVLDDLEALSDEEVERRLAQQFS